MLESSSTSRPGEWLHYKPSLHGIFSISGLAKSRMIQEMTMARKNKKL
jgi:hypothetical protein